MLQQEKLLEEKPMETKTNLKSILPRAIQPGDIIGVASPSNSILEKDEDCIKKSKELWEHLGYRVKFSSHACTNSLGYSETAKNKADDLNAMFADPEVKVIICSKGGYNSNSVLDYLDYETIQKNPKILCGFSDITTLTNAIYAKTGLVTFNGACFKALTSWETDYGFQEMVKRFQMKSLAIGTQEDAYETIHPGKAMGKLVGGNLCLTTWLASRKI